MRYLRNFWRWLFRPLYLVKPLYPIDLILYALLSGVTFNVWLGLFQKVVALFG